MSGTSLVRRCPRLALLAAISAGALLLAVLLVPGAAWADGGQSIAGAPVIAYGQQEFGSTATGGVDTSVGCDYVYSSNWSLPVTAGDQVTIDWEIQAPWTELKVFPLGTNDFNVKNTNPLEEQELTNNGKDELVFSATVSGTLPVVFQSDGNCSGASQTGPYDFTAYVRHVVRLSLPRITRLRPRSIVKVAAHTPEGGAISDPSLLVDVQLRSGHAWLSVGRAAVVNSIAAVPVRVPARFWGKVVRLRALAHGGAYESAATRSRRVFILGPPRKQMARHHHHRQKQRSK